MPASLPSLPPPRIVRAGEADLRVHDLGSGSPVLMHPSLGRPATDFAHLAYAVADAGFRVLAMNPRGIDTPRAPLKAMTLDRWAEDVVRLLDAMETGPAHVVGHAFGNRVVRRVATAAPQAVRSVCLLGAGGRVPGDADARAAVARCFDPSLPEKEHLEAVRTGFFAPGNDPAVWRHGWYPEVATAQQEALTGADPDTWWDGGRGPMLVVQGLQDRAAPPANGRLLADRRPGGAELVEVDAAGHALLPEQPETVANAVVDFLRRHDAQA